MSESRTGFVYEQIVRGIIAGKFRPGQSLNRRDIAADFNVSISPVNEAFAILQTEGIVETIPRKGTFVGRLDWRDLTELTIVRVALECEAARYYCGDRISSEKQQMLALAAAVDEQEEISFDHLHADIVFHRALVSLAGNRYLAGTFDTVITRSLLLAMEATVGAQSTTRSRLSHRKFVRDLCKATPESVNDIVRKNVFSGKEAFLEFDSLIDDDSRPETALDVILAAIDGDG